MLGVEAQTFEEIQAERREFYATQSSHIMFSNFSVKLGTDPRGRKAEVVSVERLLNVIIIAF